jgi:hypothetical protein
MTAIDVWYNLDPIEAPKVHDGYTRHGHGKLQSMVQGREVVYQGSPDTSHVSLSFSFVEYIPYIAGKQTYNQLIQYFQGNEILR